MKRNSARCKSLAKKPSRDAARTLFTQAAEEAARLGFVDGRRLIAQCPEFSLYEMYKPDGPLRTEYSRPVRAALSRALFGINDADGREGRLELASALERLAAYARNTDCGVFSEGCAVVGRELGLTLGKMLAAAFDAPDHDRRINQCVVAFKGALRAIGTGRFTSKPRLAFLIWHAETIFRSTGLRPTKLQLRTTLENCGIRYHRSDARAKWRELFEKAGLANLPSE